MKPVYLIALMLLSVTLYAQEEKPKFVMNGYVETYYSFDMNKPEEGQRPAFLYNYNRHNEFNVNLAYLKASYATGSVRANLALGTGTYMNSNYAAEPGVLKTVFEANAGVKLSRQNNLWLDVGILPSHIGFESAVGKDNWTLTRSLVAENSPYFESGAKLSYTTHNEKVTLAALLLNGWQRISRVPGNSLMSGGTQLIVKPSQKLTLNYSTFLGTDKPDSTRLFRSYHNLYAIWQMTERVGFTFGVDIGTEEREQWYAPLAILRIDPAGNWALAYRLEYFRDKAGTIISTGTPNGFATWGNSLNIDFTPADQCMIRLEGRLLSSKDLIFIKEEKVSRSDLALTFSTCIYF